MIKWGSESQYYSKNGYNGSNNVWEYYFEPMATKLNNDDFIKENFEGFLLE